MINLKAIRKAPTTNINVNPITNVHVSNRDASSETNPSTVYYPNTDDGVQGEFVSVAPQPAEISADPEKAKLLRENAVQKFIIDIQHNNPIIVNKYIIADDATLIKLVSLLCNATEVHIDADDVECGCATKNTYRKVHAIFVVVDGQTKNLKYDFSDVMYTLKELHISTKYVW